MKTLNTAVLRTIHGGETAIVLTKEEVFSVYIGSAAISNILMTGMGISPLHSFPISLFSSLIPLYYYAEAKKNPA